GAGRPASACGVRRPHASGWYICDGSREPDAELGPQSAGRRLLGNLRATGGGGWSRGRAARTNGVWTGWRSGARALVQPFEVGFGVDRDEAGGWSPAAGAITTGFTAWRDYTGG